MGGGILWLVGMMGAGKSCVGPLLAARLGRRFVDADAEVERASGLPIHEIFTREGEAGFRRRERAALEALGDAQAVVALGGGALTTPGARQRLAARGTLVYLRARPETLRRRVGAADERPLLAGLDDVGRLARLRELLTARRPEYEAADLVVDTDDETPEAVADRIAAWLAQRPA